MNVKILKTGLILFVILLISGCSKEIVYVDRPVEIKVPVKCVVPEVKCDFKKDTYTEIIDALVECIEIHKEAEKVCK